MRQPSDSTGVIVSVQRRVLTAPLQAVLDELLGSLIDMIHADGARIDDPSGRCRTSVGAIVPARYQLSASIETLYAHAGTLVAVRTREEPFEGQASMQVAFVAEMVAAAFLAVGAATRDDLASTRAEALTALHDSTAQLRTLVDSTPLGVALVRGSDLALLRTNDALARLTHLDGPTLSRLTLPDLVPQAEREEFCTWLRSVADSVRGGSRELRLARADGETTWSRLFVAWVPGAVPAQLVAQLEDITSQWHARQLLNRLAHTDPLTGLANRLQVERQLDSALSRPGNEEIGLVYVDLDGFKEVNDQLGHGAGDELLVEVADRLTAAVRPRDVVGRMGGDEFVVVVDHLVDLNELERMTKRIRAAVTDEVELSNGAHVQVSASIGLSTAGPGESPSDVIARADAQMYAEKRRHHQLRVVAPRRPVD